MFEEHKFGKMVLTEKGQRLERLRRMRGYTVGEIADIICRDNTCLLREAEIKELLWIWDRDRRELKEYIDAEKSKRKKEPD